MAARKQFLTSVAKDAELETMLKDKGKLLATDEQLREQRISFAFGNAPASSKLITKESVREASRHIRLQSET